MNSVRCPQNYEEWRSIALNLLLEGISPAQLQWSTEDQPVLFKSVHHFDRPNVQSLHKIPRKLKDLLHEISMHHSVDRWNLMYRLLYRTLHGEKQLLEDPLDQDAAMAFKMQDEIKKDIHRFHAFLRFRKYLDQEGEIYIASYKPDHYTLHAALPFFVERFGSMRWVIFTPQGSAYWNKESLGFEAPKIPADMNDEQLEQLWRSYYSSTFNPTRSNEKLFSQHIPARFRQSMPELKQITNLLWSAPARANEMIDASVPGAVTQPFESIADLNPKLQECVACPIGLNRTRAVAGEGNGAIMIVGEQPGDEEEKEGHPFVGPAGQVLNEVFNGLKLDRSKFYVTNAVKHFKFIMRGKSRIHDKPTLAEIGVCRSWLNEEIRLLQPKVIVCLGASAALSVLGVSANIGASMNREFKHPSGAVVVVTYHPAAILRAPEIQRKNEMLAQISATIERAHNKLKFEYVKVGAIDG